MVQRVGGGHGADQDQHDEAHAFLAVIGTVEEADAGAGEDEHAANPEGGRFGALGRFVEALVLDDGLHEQEEEGGEKEAKDRRKQRDLAMLAACPQSTPLVPDLADMS